MNLSAYLSDVDQGTYGGLLGGEVRCLCDPETGWISSMVPPLIRDWTAFDKLRFDENHEWFKRYLRQLEIFVEGAGDRFGIYLVDAAGAVTDSVGRQSKAVAWLGEDRLVAVEQGYLGVADVVVYGVSGGGERFTGERDVVWAGLPAVDELSATVSGDKVMLVRVGVTDEQRLFDLRGPAPRATHVTRSLNAYLGDPAFSPDGALLAYAREDALGFNNLRGFRLAQGAQ